MNPKSDKHVEREGKHVVNRILYIATANEKLQKTTQYIVFESTFHFIAMDYYTSHFRISIAVLTYNRVF